MSNNLKCPICGEPTRVYMGNARKDRLCGKHADMLKAGELAKCPDCGEWYITNETCKCKIQKKYTELPTEGFEKCAICGATTKGYAFCRKCWKEHSEEEMLNILNEVHNELIEDPNPPIPTEPPLSLFEETDDINDDTLAHEETELPNKIVIINETNKSRCITCGRKTDGVLFCPVCYNKYKNKELLFQITKCTNIELLDEDYEGRYTCKDGHVVKSKSEREIDNYLFEHGIPHAYERELSYGISEKDVLRPDFYLPHYLGKDKHIYIEHWGYNENNIQYTKTKKFKMQIYKELGITLICTYEKTDMSKIETVLERKLNKKFIEEGKIYE